MDQPETHHGVKQFTTSAEPRRNYEPEPIDSGQLVWHYCGSSALNNILVKNELWASSIAYMNDASEAILGSDALRRRFDAERATLPEDASILLEDLLPPQSSADEVSSGSGYGSERFLLSASLDDDSLSMWRAYGSADVSYAIGIDQSQLLAPLGREGLDPNPSPDYEADRFIVDDEGVQHEITGWDSGLFSGSTWFKAVYEVERSEAIVADAFNHLREMLDSVRSKPDGDTWRQIKHQVAKAFLGIRMDASRDLAIYQIKHPGFADEREARLVLRVFPRWRFVHYRASKLGFVPFVKLTSFDKLGILGDFPTAATRLPIKSIRIGPTYFPELARTGLLGLLAQHGYHDVEVMSSEIPYRPV